jgi:hypothetical protein
MLIIHRSILPFDFIQETKETLAMILPKSDKDTRKWFFKLQTNNRLDPGAIRCPSVGSDAYRIGHYKYWRSRMAELKSAYDGHQPKTPIQVWRDNRHVVQWWAFWLAALVLVLTIVFGLIQSITGILQVLSG